MTEIDALKQRVRAAAEAFSAMESERRRVNRELTDALGSLEERFRARSDEVTHYRARVEPLAVSNRELRSLVDALVELIERTVDPEDNPFYRVGAVAAELLAETMPEVEIPEAKMPEVEMAETEPCAAFEAEPAPDEGVAVRVPDFAAHEVGEDELLAEFRDAWEEAEPPRSVVDADQPGAVTAVDEASAAPRSDGPDDDTSARFKDLLSRVANMATAGGPAHEALGGRR